MGADLAPGLRALKILDSVHVIQVAYNLPTIGGILHCLDMMLGYICLLLTTTTYLLTYYFLTHLLCIRALGLWTVLPRYSALSRHDAWVVLARYIALSRHTAWNENQQF
jgi:hypothetical protein